MEQDIDLHLGRRLRSRRRLLGLTQQQLAIVVGVRFQQIQKYECGEDRISASRLWGLSEALKASVDYFYEGLEPSRHTWLGAGDDGAETHAQEEALDLVRSYRQLPEQPRRALLKLAKSLSGEPRSD